MGLSSKVNLFGLDLIWNVNQQHVEEVVACKVRLEKNLDFVSLIGSDRSSLGHKQEGYLLLAILNTENL